MKILHIIGSGQVGGAEKFVHSLAHDQQRITREHAALLYRKAEGPLVTWAEQRAISTYACPQRMGFCTIWRMLRLMRSFSILHFHGVYPILFFLAILSRRPVIFYLHGARALGKPLAKAFSDRIRSPKRPVWRGIQRLFVRNCLQLFLRHKATQIQVPSLYFKTFAQQKYGVAADKIHWLPCGIDPEWIRVQSTKNEMADSLGTAGHFLVGCVANLRPIKRIDRLLKAYAAFRIQNGTIPSQVIILGEGDLRGQLTDTIKRLQLQHSVHMPGLVPNVPDYMQLFDVLVMPSELESFSLVIAEAMFFKVPLLAFESSGGAAELVERSNAGFLVKDVQELTRKLTLLAKDEALRKELGERGHAFANHHLTMERCIESLTEAYQRTVK